MNFPCVSAGDIYTHRAYRKNGFRTRLFFLCVGHYWV